MAARRGPRAPLSESELTGHFAADFLKNVPPAQINQVLTSFGAMKLERLVSAQERQLVARVVVGRSPFDVTLVVDAASLITSLMFRSPTPQSWGEVDERLSELSPQAGFLAAELTADGRCRPVHALAADEARPLGSMVKLYVLGAVAERIKGARSAGTRSSRSRPS
ncbi:Cpe/LpqF family protein [Nonomuraea antimicrobica]